MRLKHLLAGLLAAAPIVAHAQGALQTVLPSQTAIQPGASTAMMVPACVTAAGADVAAGLSTTCGAHGTTGIPVSIVSGGSSGSTSGGTTTNPCTTSTVATTATLVLDSVANGTGRASGAFVMPATGTTVYYQWSNSSAGLTAAQGGIVSPLYPGGNLPFAGAPQTQLWMISTASVTGSCFYGK